MRKAYKSIISLSVVLIAGLNFVVPAFAQDPFTAIAVGGLTGASGAGLFSSMASLTGVNINYTSTDPVDAMWNVLNPDHVYFSGEKHEATGTGEDIYDYIQVDIGDWLSAQQEFIKEFCQNYNVTDNDSGQTTVTKSYAGIPFDSNGKSGYLGVYPFLGTVQYGQYKVVSTQNGSKYHLVTYLNDTFVGEFDQYNYWGTCSTYLQLTNNPDRIQLRFDTGNDNFACGSNAYVTITNDQGINWTSDTVDTTVFDGWESAKVKIPSQISQLQSGWTLSDFLNELDRIWSGAGEDNIIIEDGAVVPPVPPSPIPDTPLGDVPFDDWIDLWGQGIYQQLENQSDALDLIGSNGIDAIEELESIDTNTEDLVETAESIDTNIGFGNGILGGIRSLAQSAVSYLEGIAEHVGELVEEIVEGTETLIAGILNQIPQAFSVIFGPIKQASSIWHYVVEWITSIGAPFQFIWSMASGTSYYVILPVYASLAAAVVLAFFKRFGR